MGLIEILLVVGILLLVFGPGKLGGIGGAVQKSIRDFKTVMREDEAPDAKSKPSEPDDGKANHRI